MQESFASHLAAPPSWLRYVGGLGGCLVHIDTDEAATLERNIAQGKPGAAAKAREYLKKLMRTGTRAERTRF
jgi:hypothetical protein